MTLYTSASKNLSPDQSGLSQQFAVTAGIFTGSGGTTVSWSGVKVQVGGVEYSISDGSTTAFWIFWDSSSPTSFYGAATIPTGANSTIVGINASGTFVSQWKVGQVINAWQLNVATLSAITANLGTVTAGSISGITITGSTIRTAASGQRLQFDSINGIIGYDSYNTELLRIPLPSSSLLIGAVGLELHSSFAAGSSLTICGGHSRSTNIMMYTSDGSEINNRSAISLSHNPSTISLATSNAVRAMFTPSGLTMYSNITMESGDIDAFTNNRSISANTMRCNTLQVGTHYATGDTLITGFIWINDSGGVAHKMAIVS